MILSARHLRKSYGTTPILHDLSLDLQAGERVALLGPSGGGKSTLLNCLGGVDRADSGEILFQGEDLQQMSANRLAALRRGSIGTIFQFFHLLPTLSARENIALPLQLLGWTREAITARVNELLDLVRLQARAEARPGDLSGGERQRVAIARALAGRPVLLLADEPTGNLDTATGEAILDLLEEVSATENAALLMVTHNELATRICHRVLTIRDGRFVSADQVAG